MALCTMHRKRAQRDCSIDLLQPIQALAEGHKLTWFIEDANDVVVSGLMVR